MSFEIFRDQYDTPIRPRKGLLVIHRKSNFGGKTASGIILEGPDHLPMVFGVVVAIRHDCEFCVLNLPRDDGGIMPGDLVHFARYSADQGHVADLALVADAERYNEETRSWETVDCATIEPAYVLPEESVLARVDGILPDAWEAALENLSRKVPDLVVSSP